MDYSTPFLIFGDKNTHSVLGQFNESIRAEISRFRICEILDLNTFGDKEKQFLEENDAAELKDDTAGLIQVGNNRFSNWNLLASRKGNYTLLIHDLYIWDAWDALLQENPLLLEIDFIKTRILEPSSAKEWLLETGWEITEKTVNSVELLVRLMLLANGVITHSSWAQHRLLELQDLIPDDLGHNLEIHSVPLPYFNATYFEGSNTDRNSELRRVREHAGVVFSSLGSHDNNRGLLESISALAEINLSDVMLVVAGLVDPLVCKSALEIKKDLKVVFLGSVSQAEYQEVIEKTSIFINFRKMPYEAASGTLVDSLRTGKLTVINNTGCRRDYTNLSNSIVIEDLSISVLTKVFLNAINTFRMIPRNDTMEGSQFQNLSSYAATVAETCSLFVSNSNLSNYSNIRNSLLLGYDF